MDPIIVILIIVNIIMTGVAMKRHAGTQEASSIAANSTPEQQYKLYAEMERYLEGDPQALANITGASAKALESVAMIKLTTANKVVAKLGKQLEELNTCYATTYDSYTRARYAEKMKATEQELARQEAIIASIGQQYPRAQLQ